MALKYLRDSLPWLVPSAAIVFAASGFLDLGNGKGDEPAAESAALTAPVVAPQPAPAPAAAPVLAPADEEVVTRQVAPDTSLTSVVAPAPQPQPLAAAPAPAPAPVVAPSPTRTAALGTTQSAAPFFNSNTFTANAQQQCIEDLRTMASQARVYFPSGGLTADQGGIEQGRLIGLIAQSCPG
ncbi:MAG: hypothetical protein AB3N17_05805, partial [Tateyamaria sp.]